MRRAWLFGLVLCGTSALADPPGPESVDARTRLRAEAAHPLADPADLTPLIEAAGDRRLVLLGEATHGSHEFYVWRAAITRRLIAEKGYTFVAVEADWPSLMPLDAYVRGVSVAPASAAEALGAVTRWPAWLWRNREFADFAEWLRGYNLARPAAERVALRGMDVYGPAAAMQAVLDNVVKQDAVHAAELAVDFDCLARHGEDGKGYTRAISRGSADCEAGLAKAETRLRARFPASTDSVDLYNLMRAIRNAEAYYRLSASSDGQAWNRRGGHMWETVADLLGTAGSRPAKGIVWAHNSHVGDAWYSALAWYGLENIGQLSRRALGAGQVYGVGFSTARGHALAARAWGDPPEVMAVPPARPGSLDERLARTSASDGFILFGSAERDFLPLNETVLQRGIGVVYLAEHDATYYLPSRVPWRFDALVSLPDTSPLTRLDDTPVGR